MGLGGSFTGVDRQQAGGREGVYVVWCVCGGPTTSSAVQYTAGHKHWFVVHAGTSVVGWVVLPLGGLHVAGSSGGADVQALRCAARTVSTQTEVVRAGHVWCEGRRQRRVRPSSPSHALFLLS